MTTRRPMRTLPALALLALALGARGAQAAPEVDAILRQLAATATPEQTRQIADAIQSSPWLAAQLEDLAAVGKLTRIRVVAPESLPARLDARELATLNNNDMIITAPLLAQLARTTPAGDAHSDQVRPNNTVFVLAYLAHHLRNADHVRLSIAEALGHIADQRHRAGPYANNAIVLTGQRVLLTEGAGALIDGWNATIDAATAQAHAPLKPAQTVSVVLGMRYRAIFNKALTQTPRLQIEESGRIEPTAGNMEALIEALKISHPVELD